MRPLALVFAFVTLSLAACSKDDPPSGAGGAGGASDAAAPDAADGTRADGGAGQDAEATDATAPGKTALEAKINGVSRPLDRAQLGTERDDAGAALLYVEAHSGGDPACPDPDGGAAPSPERTLVLSGVPRGAPGSSHTFSDGVRAAYFDFTGDQLSDAPLTKATAVTATIVAVDSADPPASADIDIEATFPEGTVTGRVHATYCASLSQ